MTQYYAIGFKTQPDANGSYRLGYIGLVSGEWREMYEPIYMPLGWVEKGIAWFTSRDRFRDRIIPTWIENSRFELVPINSQYTTPL